MKDIFLEKNFIHKGLIGVSVLLFGWFIVLNPVNKESQKIRGTYKILEDEINQIYVVLGTQKSVPDRIVDMLKRLEELKHKCPCKEETVLKELSRTISDFGLIMENIKVMEKKIYNHSSVDGSVPMIVPLDIDVSGDFFSLGKFLEYLEVGFPYFVQVNQLDVYTRDIPTIVVAKIGMSIYLLVPGDEYGEKEN